MGHSSVEVWSIECNALMTEYKALRRWLSVSSTHFCSVGGSFGIIQMSYVWSIGSSSYVGFGIEDIKLKCYVSYSARVLPHKCRQNVFTGEPIMATCVMSVLGKAYVSTEYGEADVRNVEVVPYVSTANKKIDVRHVEVVLSVSTAE